MNTNSNIIQKGINSKSFSHRVYNRKKRPDVFTIHPVGSMDANAYPIIEKKAEQILKLAPEVIIFDMQHVNYINSQGLRVILKVQRAMKLRGGRVVLINPQPHIKEVFDIINALPAQRIFVNQEELDNYLDAMQSHCVGAKQEAIPQARTSVFNGAAAGASAAGA